MNKKKLLAISLVISMIAILSFSTLAWFTDKDTVENKFLVAGSDDKDPDEIFSVDVWENTPEGIEDQDGYTYNDILPGDKLKKEVYVENTGSYDQYIRVTVTISDAQAWIAALGADADVTEVFVGFDATQWTHIWNNLAEDPNAEEIIYVMFYKNILGVDEKIEVFTDIQIPTSLTQQQAAQFAGGFTIDIKADAVQTENVVPEGTAAEDAAWAAFKTVEG